MSEKINIIVAQQAITELQTAIDKVGELKTAIASVKTVSGSNSFASGVKDQSNEVADLKNRLAMIASLNKQRYEQEAKLIADNDKALTLKSERELKQIRDKQAMIASLNKQKNEEIEQDKKLALANEKLNSAYNKLNKARTDAKNHLRDLIASERASTAEINKAQKAFDVLDQKIRKADKAVGDMSKNVDNYKSAFSGLSNLMGAFGIGTGIYLAVDVAKNIYETTKQLQSLDLALKMVSETSAIYASNTAFIAQISEKWGIEIKGLTEQFTQFYVNAKGKLSEDKIKETFEGIAKAGSLMGISIDKQNDAFYAFNQMLSKGTVQGEELKKQLGNALPGAIKAATMAYQELNPNLKVTEQMMLDQMKAGKLVSNEMVPAIIKAYQKLYGIEMTDKVGTLASAQNRLKNSWTELVRSMNESKTGGISVFFTFISEKLTGLLKGLSRFNTDWQKLQEISGQKGRESAERIYIGMRKDGEKFNLSDKENDQSILDYARKRNIELRKEEVALLAKLNDVRVRGKDLFKLEKEELSFKIGSNEELIKITRTKLGLDKELAKTGGTGTTETEAQSKAREKAEKDRLDAIDKLAKEEYEANLSNLQKRKENISDYLQNEKNFNIDQTSIFKFGSDERLKYSMKLAQSEIAIAELIHKEKLRIANKDIKERGLTPAQGANVLTPINNDFDKSKNDALQAHLKRASNIYSDYFKSLDNMPDTIFGDKFKLTPEQEKELKDYNEKLKDTLKQQIKIFNEFVGDFANKSGFSQTFDSFIKEDKNGVSLMDTLFDDKAIMSKEEKMKNTFLAISSAAQDMFNIISEASQKNFDAEYSRLDEQKEAALKNAGDSAAAKIKILEEYDKKKRQIDIREAKAKQKQTMFNIAIDIAQAIISVWAQVPKFDFGVSATALTAAIGALGAIQLGVVAAQKIPQYWRGTKNAPEGLALTNEKGAEIHTDRHGNIKDFGHNKGATLTKMDAGDIVYTAEQSRRMMFENEYHGLLRNNGINVAKPNNAMTASEMEAVMIRTLGGRPVINFGYDQNGFYNSITRNGNTTKRAEGRGNGLGLEV
jgi:tape measure domain-containing protein